MLSTLLRKLIKKLKEMRLGSAARWVERCVEDAYVLRVSVVTWRRIRTQSDGEDNQGDKEEVPCSGSFS